MDTSVLMFTQYLVDYIFIVVDIVLKVHSRFPGVILGVNAAAGGFAIFMTGHSQGIPAKGQWETKISENVRENNTSASLSIIANKAVCKNSAQMHIN